MKAFKTLDQPQKPSLDLSQRRPNIKHCFLQPDALLARKSVKNRKKSKSQILIKYFGKTLTLVRCRTDVVRLHEKMKYLRRIDFMHHLGKPSSEPEFWGTIFHFRNVCIRYNGDIVLLHHKFRPFKAPDFGYEEREFDGDYEYYLDGYVGPGGSSCAIVERGLEFDSIRMVFRYTKPEPREHIKFAKAVKALISRTGYWYYYGGGDGTNILELQFLAKAFNLKGLCKFALKKRHRGITLNYLQALLQYLKTSTVSSWFVRAWIERSEPFTAEECSHLFDSADFLRLVYNNISDCAHYSWHTSDSYVCNDVTAEELQYSDVLRTLLDQTSKCLELWLTGNFAVSRDGLPVIHCKPSLKTPCVVIEDYNVLSKSNPETVIWWGREDEVRKFKYSSPLPASWLDLSMLSSKQNKSLSGLDSGNKYYVYCSARDRRDKKNKSKTR